MGRPREKETTDNYRTLSISSLKRDSQLQSGKAFDWAWWRRGEQVASIGITIESRYSLRLRYQSRRQNSEPVQHDYPVAITWTACHLGGERPWFRCPDCGQRVLKLYGGARFICRNCLRLNYTCQQTSKRNRALDRAWKLRHKLGCDYGPFDYPAEYIQRPKGMHRKTFARRIELLMRVEARAFCDVERMLKSLEHRVAICP